MVATAINSVTMVLWKETAFALSRAMERRWLGDHAYGHEPWIDGF